jgi:flagellar biosynthesis protein FlhB
MVLHSLERWERTLTRRDLTRLFVKFFGLIIILIAIVPLLNNIVGFIFVLRSLDASNAIYTWQTVALMAASLFIPLAVQVVIGLCFIRWSGRIADKVSPAPEKDEIVEAADLRNIEVTLVAMLGLYFIAEGFAELCIELYRWIYSGSLSEIWNYFSSFIYTLVKLAIGVLLVLGRGGSTAMRHRVHAWVQKWRTWPD